MTNIDKFRFDRRFFLYRYQSEVTSEIIKDIQPCELGLTFPQHKV